jgi:CDP-2,3-bis-(O-geranylgeranyl)-sn-glycerol synthase
VVAEAVFRALWLLLPAYVANPAAVLWGGGMPMDFGRSLPDGRRILGDGKTWRGFVGGVASGGLVALLMEGAATALQAPILSYGPSPLFPLVPLVLATGSLLGDVAGAFAKRRLGLPRGARAPGLDQYDFLAGALGLCALAFPGWLLLHYVAGEAWAGLLAVLVATPLLHRGVNILGYRMGKKEVPW